MSREYLRKWLEDEAIIQKRGKVQWQGPWEWNVYPLPEVSRPPTEVGGPIIAWRVWHAREVVVDTPWWADPVAGPFITLDFPRSWRLFSWSQGQVHWAPRQALVANQAPRIGSGLGIHAFKDDKRARSLAAPRSLYQGNSVPVYGRVSLWGRYVECEFGYRAEFAYPYDLYVAHRDAADALRQAYAVDVNVIDRPSDAPPYGWDHLAAQFRTMAATTQNVHVKWKRLRDVLP